MSHHFTVSQPRIPWLEFQGRENLKHHNKLPSSTELLTMGSNCSGHKNADILFYGYFMVESLF